MPVTKISTAGNYFVLLFLNLILTFSYAQEVVVVEDPNLRGGGNTGELRLADNNDPRVVTLKNNIQGGTEALLGKNRRKFLKYESSIFEQVWLDNVDRWASLRMICQNLHTPQQLRWMHDFLKLMCTAYPYQAPYNAWCIIDDLHRPMYYNTANRTNGSYEISFVEPSAAQRLSEYPDATFIPDTVILGPEHEHVLSKFTFLDEETGVEYVEYIEPLISHLRFPLSNCIDFLPYGTDWALKTHWYALENRGWIIAPPANLKSRSPTLRYWDAGASDWASGMGGSSLRFFYEQWKRRGNTYDEIYAYEMTTTTEDFYKTVPFDVKDRVYYQQCAVVSEPKEEKLPDSPFIPSAIKRKQSSINDYVLFKLDIDSPVIEHGSVNFILEDEENPIDELFWEHHVAGNYLMTEWGKAEHQAQFTLRESYELFLRMRQKGIRGHSWI